jgi:hypothetical protein
MSPLVRLVATTQDAREFRHHFALTLNKKRVTFAQGLATSLLAPSLLFCAIRALIRDVE